MVKGTSVFEIMATYRSFQHAKSLYLTCFRHVNETVVGRCAVDKPLKCVGYFTSVRSLHKVSTTRSLVYSHSNHRLNGRMARWSCLSAAGVQVRFGSSTVSLENSTSSDPALLSMGKEMSTDVATTLLSVPEDAATVIASVSEPTLQSLGLGGFMPSGLVQTGLESLHIGLDVPWWTAIVIGTICVRLAIFPLVILAQRNAANMHNHMPTMQRLQEKMSQARMSGDMAEAVKTGNELMQYMHRHNVNPVKNMLVPFAQAPIFISVFVGVREMASLPVESMKSGGILWFTDLTIPDPFYALPILTMSTLLATIEVGVDGVKAGAMGQNVKFILRAMPFVCFPFIIKFPALGATEEFVEDVLSKYELTVTTAMLCYWFTSNAFSLLQVLFLRIPSVRTFFKIPELFDHSHAAPMKKLDVPKLSFMDGFRQTMTNIKVAAEMEERQRVNALRLKESSKTIDKTKPTISDKPSDPKKQ